MKVHDSNLNNAAAAQTGGAQEVHGAGRSAGTRSAGAGSGSDRVELSDTLGALSRALAAHRSERAARVHELAAQHQRSEYRPDSAATSRALVSDAMGAGSP